MKFIASMLGDFVPDPKGLDPPADDLVHEPFLRIAPSTGVWASTARGGVIDGREQVDVAAVCCASGAAQGPAIDHNCACRWAGWSRLASQVPSNGDRDPAGISRSAFRW